MGFTELLTLIFIVLKLLGTISWSWWLVLLPEIIATAIYLLVLILGLVGVGKANKAAKKIWNDFDKHC